MQKINLYLKLISYLPLMLILFFVLVLVIGWIIIWPKFNDYSGLKQSIEIKEIELRYKEEYIEKLQGIKDKLDESGVQISKIASALPSENSAPSVYKFIEETASGAGLVLNDISPFQEDPSQINTRLKETSFSLSLSGSYSALKVFLSVLERSARLFDMNSMSLNTIEEGESFDFLLNVRAFNY
jgi:Tfp pilus assembly protein PilO